MPASSSRARAAAGPGATNGSRRRARRDRFAVEAGRDYAARLASRKRPPSRTNERSAEAPREVSARDLEEAALRYLNRFDCSARKLTRHLEKRAAGAANPAEIALEISTLIERYRRSGLIDDRRFAESRARGLRERGASSRLIAEKLRVLGVDRDVIDQVLRAAAERNGAGSELEAAAAYVRRKRLGRHRPEAQQLSERRRDLARLARQGFDFDTASRALGLGRDDDF